MTELLKVAITLTTAAIANHDVAIPNVVLMLPGSFQATHWLDSISYHQRQLPSCLKY